MNQKSEIIKTATHIRLLLWFFVAFVIVCTLGVPALFNIEIEPLKNSGWIELGYLLLDSWLNPDEAILLLSNQQSMLAGLIFFLVLACFCLLVWCMDRLFREYAFGHFFTATCIQHFYFIGWLLVFLFVFTTVGDNLVEQLYVLQDEKVTESNFGEQIFAQFISLDFSLLLAGLFVVAVARVMQQGALLQADVDSTI